MPDLRGDIRRRPTVAATGADGVLILRRAAKRSPADAARIASRVMQHVEKFDRRGDRTTLNLASLRRYNPSVAERFGEAELRAAASPQRGCGSHKWRFDRYLVERSGFPLVV